MTTDFTPTLYFKHQCPHCFKVRLYLMEAGLRDQVDIRVFEPGTPGEDDMRAELAPHLEKITFPAAKLAPGDYIADSDGIIDWFADRSGVEPGQLETFNAYVEGPYKRVRDLFMENKELKAKLG